jgi:hypothetical protein
LSLGALSGDEVGAPDRRRRRFDPLLTLEQLLLDPRSAGPSCSSWTNGSHKMCNAGPRESRLPSAIVMLQSYASIAASLGPAWIDPESSELAPAFAQPRTDLD